MEAKVKRKRPGRLRSEKETQRKFKCRYNDCGFESNCPFGVNTHARKTHLDFDDLEDEVFADPIEQCSDPDFETFPIDHIETVSDDNTPENVLIINGEDDSEIVSDIDQEEVEDEN